MVYWKRVVANLAETQYLNVPKRYQHHHVALAILLIGERQPLGRYDLTDSMTIGEGSVRTLLKRLTKEGYITAEQHHGQSLTKKGQGLFEDIKQDIPFGLFVDIGNLAIYQYSFANLIKGKGNRVKDGVLQRDEALICAGYGRAGATTLVMRNGLLVMPPDDTNTLLENERESILLLDSLRPEEGDAIVIGSSIDSNMAREVAMAASTTLC